MGLDPDKDVIYFGRTDYRGAKRLFGIKRSDRRQHVYVMGKTGTGKSALLGNMITQDIANGEGVCVVDPHGELVETILECIPEERIKDVVYLNPADMDSHIGFNILELPDPRYKHLVASGLMGIFTKIWAGVWSARMEYIMNNCVLALLDNPGSTLLGIPRLLTDQDYRQQVIANVQDPVVRAFWLNEYEQWQDKFRSEAIAPLQNKVGQFLSTELIRNMVGQSKSTIDIFDIMNSGKIFLVNVSKGRIGEDNSALLGAMIITKIQLHAMERVRIPENERVDFYLYVDEFQNFATDSFASILSEARKYRLNLIIAHQYVGQLVTDTSTKVRDAVFGNVGTMIIFRVGATDAEFLENEFEPEFIIQDIVNLPNHCIYLKLMVNGVTCRPFSAATLPPFKVKSSPELVQNIINESRRRYARPRQIVEEEIQRWSGVSAATGSTAPADGNAGKVNCTVCGKSVNLPFVPDLSRPVYCKSCLAKVKSGEIRPPPRLDRNQRPALQNKGLAALAELGIEFEAGSAEGRPAGPGRDQSRGRAPDRSLPDQRPSRPAAAATAPSPAVAPPAPDALSLTDLKPQEKVPKKKPGKEEVSIAELQDAIAKSLNQAGGEEGT